MRRREQLHGDGHAAVENARRLGEAEHLLNPHGERRRFRVRVVHRNSRSARHLDVRRRESIEIAALLPVELRLEQRDEIQSFEIAHAPDALFGERGAQPLVERGDRARRRTRRATRRRDARRTPCARGAALPRRATGACVTPRRAIASTNTARERAAGGVASLTSRSMIVAEPLAPARGDGAARVVELDDLLSHDLIAEVTAHVVFDRSDAARKMRLSGRRSSNSAATSYADCPSDCAASSSAPRPLRKTYRARVPGRRCATRSGYASARSDPTDSGARVARRTARVGVEQTGESLGLAAHAHQRLRGRRPRGRACRAPRRRAARRSASTGPPDARRTSRSETARRASQASGAAPSCLARTSMWRETRVERQRAPSRGRAR